MTDLTTMPPGMVAVPTQHLMPARTAIAIAGLRTPLGSCTLFDAATTFPDRKRNNLVDQFLKRPALQWMFFIDADELPAPDTIERLWATSVQTSAHIVSALYFGREYPYLPEAGMGYAPTGAGIPLSGIPEGPAGVTWVGGGALLVRREVLEKVPAPWFLNADGVASEDFYFCAKARAAGFSIVLDPSVEVPHLTVMAVTRGLWQAAIRGRFAKVMVPGLGDKPLAWDDEPRTSAT